MLSGNLSNWSVADLLQMMRVTSKTAALRIEGTRAGVIHFNEGKLAAPPLPVSAPRWSSTSFADRRSMHYSSSPDLARAPSSLPHPEFDPTSSSWEVTEIMAEVEHLRLIEAEIRALGVEENSPLVLSADVPSPVTLHAEDWATLVALVPAFSLASLERTMGRTRAFQVVNALLARGLTVKDTAFEVDPALPHSGCDGPDAAEEFPVLEWLGDHPAEGAIDLSTDIPTSPRPEEPEPVEADPKRHSEGRPRLGRDHAGIGCPR